MTSLRWLAATANALTAVPLAAASMDGFSPQRLSSHVQTLGSDAYEGRGVNTRAEVKTVDYIVGQFKAAGLQPGGDPDGSTRKWTQDVPLLQSDWQAAPRMTMNLGGQQVPLTQGEQIAARAPTNGQSAVNLDNVPLVFVGYGVKAAERNWDDFKGQDLRGKVMVVLVNDP